MKCLTVLALYASVTFTAYPNLQLAYRFQNSAVDWSGNGRNGTVTGSGVYTTARGQQALSGGMIVTPAFVESGQVVVFSASVRSNQNATNDQTLYGNAGVKTDRRFVQLVRRAGSNDLKLLYKYPDTMYNRSTWLYVYTLYVRDSLKTDSAVAANFFAAPYNDAWVRLCVVCDYTGKNCYFYREGNLFCTVALSGAPKFPNDSLAKYFAGDSSQMCDVRQRVKRSYDMPICQMFQHQSIIDSGVEFFDKPGGGRYMAYLHGDSWATSVVSCGEGGTHTPFIWPNGKPNPPYKNTAFWILLAAGPCSRRFKLLAICCSTDVVRRSSAAFDSWNYTTYIDTLSSKTLAATRRMVRDSGGQSVVTVDSSVAYWNGQWTGYLQDVKLYTLPGMPPLAVMNASVARIAADGMPVW